VCANNTADSVLLVDWRAGGHSMSDYPISKVCPLCGCTKYKKARPKTWIAFIDDRVCLECTERYTPPTPAWASGCFIVIGIVFVLLAPIGVGISLLRLIVDPAGLACYVALGLLGVASIVYGVRSLNRAGKA
jgi:hypothetical protein